jgi:outer membrane protein assembly factor BamB
MNVNKEIRVVKEINSILDDTILTSTAFKNSCYEKGLFALSQEKAVKRNRVRYLFASAAAILITITAVFITNKEESQSTGWLFVAGDAGNSRVVNTEVKTANTKQLAWRAEINSPTGAYKPLAWNGLIIAGKGLKNGGALISFDAVTGETKWEQSFSKGDMFKSRRYPDRCISGSRLYITDGDVCHVLDAATGSKLQILDAIAGKGWSYLTASRDKLFGLTRDGKTLFAVKAKNGKLLWSKKLSSPAHVPALSSEVIFCQSEDGQITAISTTNGKARWTTSNSTLNGKGYIQAHNKHLSIITENDRMALYSSENGSLLWETSHTNIFNQGAAIGDSIVYLMGGAEALYAESGKAVWTYIDQSGVICASPTLHNGHIISTSGLGQGKINIMNNIGEIISTVHAIDSRACDGAIVFDGMIFTVGSGHVVAYGG